MTNPALTALVARWRAEERMQAAQGKPWRAVAKRTDDLDALLAAAPQETASELSGLDGLIARIERHLEHVMSPTRTHRLLSEASTALQQRKAQETASSDVVLPTAAELEAYLATHPARALETPMTEPTFEKRLEAAINATSQENASNTPDFVLAQYLLGCLAAWNNAVTARERWYGREAETIALASSASAPTEAQEKMERTELEAQIDVWMAQFPIQQTGGVGRAYTAFLAAHSLLTRLREAQE